MTMTLEQVRDKLRRYAKDADTYFNRTRETLELTSADLLADAIDAHLTQPAQSVDVIPEGCIAVPRSLVERWANVDAFNAPVGAAMELRVIAGEMLMHAAALQEKGNE